MSSQHMQLPFSMPIRPMSPILSETIPNGEEWGFQLKWDGVRIMAKADGEHVQLYSKHGAPKAATYPEVVDALKKQNIHVVLDGEMVIFDPVTKRPDFQKILIREKSKTRLSSYQPIYVVFDVLYAHGTDLREYNYEKRHQILSELFPIQNEHILVTELFSDGERLWEWVIRHDWEGIVSKRLHSPYREGKQHNDWFKKKKKVNVIADIVGIVMNAGLPKSLVMRNDGSYIGKVSLGLSAEDRRVLFQFIQSDEHVTKQPPFPLHDDLRQDQIVWLKAPFRCEVTALEFTAAGVLRHPKIVHFRH